MNNLNFLIDQTFNKVNRLFVLVFKNETDRTSLSSFKLKYKILIYYLMIGKN